MVYDSHELPFDIFLVTNGTFADVKDSAPYMLHGFNSYFGDCELLLKLDMRMSSVRCESDTGTALALAKQGLSLINNEFPHFAEAWRRAARRREMHRKKLRKARIVGINHRDFAATVIQQRLRMLHRQDSRAQLLDRKWVDQINHVTDVTAGTLATSELNQAGSGHAGIMDAEVSSLQHQVASVRSSVSELRNEFKSEMNDMRNDIKQILKCLEAGSASQKWSIHL
eukprot:gnl/TRDRNA2_/TRDRNA2_171888_c1_seq3.p1 gnl/TRDRNA2_/TRDRNA2_171888_c1~~gnl/TRDRNA2_/TRDRNA2_171888_c1_seq3.p1  ORF type:complete len:240 (+),score=38.64 gnl/TRDRNA2_/TRDRNA2_171888_c1_seq3:45-722(+)